MSVDESIVLRIKAYLEQNGITPCSDFQTATKENPRSLLIDQKLDQFPNSDPFPAGIISWSPPMQNW